MRVSLSEARAAQIDGRELSARVCLGADCEDAEAVSFTADHRELFVILKRQPPARSDLELTVSSDGSELSPSLNGCFDDCRNSDMVSLD